VEKMAYEEFGRLRTNERTRKYSLYARYEEQWRSHVDVPWCHGTTAKKIFFTTN